MDLNDLIRQLIEEGGVTIEITVKRMDEKKRGIVTINCPYCKEWGGAYTRKSSADRALRTHLQHCAEYNRNDDHSWITDMHSRNKRDK